MNGIDNKEPGCFLLNFRKMGGSQVMNTGNAQLVRESRNDAGCSNIPPGKQSYIPILCQQKKSFQYLPKSNGTYRNSFYESCHKYYWLHYA